MRFLLHLSVDPKFRSLPINYLYEISSWIYRRVESSDSDFSVWLHHMGKRYNNKRFKFFNFSNIHLPQYRFAKDYLDIESDTACLQISFCFKEIQQHFMAGVFMNETFTISDGKYKAKFRVDMIEQQLPISFEKEHIAKCDTPICLSHNVEGKKHPSYLAPSDEGYENYFFNNLMFKYHALYHRQDEFDETKERLLAQGPMRLKVLDKPRSKMIKLNANKSHPLSVRGYTYRFAIEAPPELIELGYYAGFGEKNSQGFGFTELICFGN